ncbi:MAG: nucleotidyltransferase domain-containing protein [Nanoarchaeota archaeon]
MSLDDYLSDIKRYLKERYKDNLSAILIFGSANTGHFVERKSDIDLIILLKNKKELNLEREKEILFKERKSLKWSIVHFDTIKEYEKHIYKKGSWSSWITVINGSKKLYRTNEFEKFRKRLISKPISKKKLKKYIKDKDKFELDGYFKNIKEFESLKGLFSHLRRKLQIMNYYENKTILFDYEKCLKNINLDKNKEIMLNKLYDNYVKRKTLPKKDIDDYYEISRELTKKTINY